MSYRRMTLSLEATAAMVTKLRLQGLKVRDWGSEGWDCEVDGTQIFRATNTGADRYHVRLANAVFPDV